MVRIVARKSASGSYREINGAVFAVLVSDASVRDTGSVTAATRVHHKEKEPSISSISRTFKKDI